jgi:hypothetical protein
MFVYQLGACNGQRCNERFVITRLQSSSGKIIKIYPNTLPEPIDENIPEAIQMDLDEAGRCFVAGAYRAAAVMARRALQNVALDKEAPTTHEITLKDGKKKKVSMRLVDQIDWLFKQGIITKDLRDWAHEVRGIGNDGVHPADAEDVTVMSKEDAEYVIALANAFCSPLYVASKRYLDRQTNKRGSKAVEIPTKV